MLVVLAISSVVLHCFFGLPYSNAVDYSCSNTSYCQDQLGNSYCNSQEQCVCDSYSFYQSEPFPSCQECPEAQESCEESLCCAEGLVCYQGIDVCIYIDQTWSVSESERLRFQRVAQFVLAVALILTAIILFILFWKACSRHNSMNEPMSSSSFPTLNSIQRFVLMKLQDRPPPYNPEYMRPSKSEADHLPSYIEAISAVGQDNQVFILGESSASASGGPFGHMQAYVITPQQQRSSQNNALPPPPPYTAVSENRQMEGTLNTSSRDLVLTLSQNMSNHYVLEEGNTSVNLHNCENVNEIHI